MSPNLDLRNDFYINYILVDYMPWKQNKMQLDIFNRL